MDEAIGEELKLGELMRNDIRRELDVLQTMSSSLLMLDLKRKRIESHFDSLAKMIERKREEVIEAIRVREEESKLEEERRLEELRLKEVRVESLRNGVFGEIFLRSQGIDVEMRKLERFERKLKVRESEIERFVAEFERRVEEFEGKEKEMAEAKMDVARLCKELVGKEREIVGLKNEVDEVKGRMKVESERRDAECRKLADENVALREEIKLLNEKLELKLKVPGREEQLEVIQKFLNVLTSEGIINIRSPIKESEVSGKELFITVRDSINDQGAAVSKVSSVLLEAKEKAPELVVEALIISYLSESEEKNSQSLLGPCRILLLEQLGHICPHRKSQARKEALKVAREWSAQLDSCALKPVEISRFVQFLSVYDMASEFSDEVLIPMLHCIAVHEGTPDFCLTLGFSDRITGYIKSMIGKNQWLKALDYVTTFKMAKEFPVVRMVQGHLKGLKENCQRILKEGEDRKAAEVEVLDLKIKSLEELIKCIKDLKLQSIYTTGNLEERVAKLKRQKYSNKRPAPCSDPNSDHEPPRKKGCNHPGTAKSPETIPHVSNARPDIGSRDLLCSRPIYDSDPLGKNIRKLPETVVTPNASDANPKVKSGELISSKRNSHAEPQRNNKRELPGTPRPTEVAQNTSNASPETGSRDVGSSKSNSDPEPLRRKGCSFSGTAKLKEAASNTSNASPETGSRDVGSSKSNSDPEPLRSKGCNLPGTAKLKEAAPNTSNASPETRSRDVGSSKSNSDPEPLRSKGCNLPRTAKKTEAASNTSNAAPETGSRDAVTSKSNSNHEPLRSKGCNLPGTAKLTEVGLNTSKDALCSKTDINPRPMMNTRCNLSGPSTPQDVAPKGTLAAYSEIRSKDVVSSNPNSYRRPLRKTECKLPVATKSTKDAQKTSNAVPEIGSRDILRSKTNSYRGPIRDKGYNLPGTAKLREVVLNTSNAYRKIDPRDAFCSKPNTSPEPWRNNRCNFPRPVKPLEIAPKDTLNACTELESRNTLHSREMQKASFHYDPLSFCYGVPAGSPYSYIPSRPSGYQPPLPTQTPQYYRLENNLQPHAPSWHYSVPDRPPYFDYRC